MARELFALSYSVDARLLLGEFGVTCAPRFPIVQRKPRKVPVSKKENNILLFSTIAGHDDARAARPGFSPLSGVSARAQIDCGR